MYFYIVFFWPVWGLRFPVSESDILLPLSMHG